MQGNLGPTNARGSPSDAEMEDADQIVARPPASAAKRRGSLSTTSSLSPTPDVISRPPHVTISPNKPSTAGTSESASMSKREHPSPTMPHNDSDALLAVDNLGELGGPSPYGTRSRNRTGSSRPNYAEDREPDMEYELTSNKKSHALNNTISTKLVDEKTASHGGRRTASNPAGATGHKATTNSAVFKDYIPGMSSFSVNVNHDSGGSQSSKKRKTIGGNGQKVAQGGPGYAHASAQYASPPGSHLRSNNVYSFESSKGCLRNGKLHADDGTTFELNDHVYLVCEPPGEPYYLARIMAFLHQRNDPNAPVESLRINWVYRPRDIPRQVHDTRLVYVTMHSDTCPITSLRGKNCIKHKSEIHNLEEYRVLEDHFYFVQMFDRYIHRYYEVIPTRQVINVPERVKKVLDDRWKFVIVELGRGKELTSAIKTCARCSTYSANNESVDCAMCKNTYHMNCVQPPLLKKPARGFGWSCGRCSLKQERLLETRDTPLTIMKMRQDEEDIWEEEDEEQGPNSNPSSGSTPAEPHAENGQGPTPEQLAQAKLWPYRYFGIHCRVEDALDYDDRIYPRAASRLGPRHQANVTVWYGHPIEFVKPIDIKKKYAKGTSHKKDAKPSKETVAALEAEKMAREKRPKWVYDEPLGYVARGEDHFNRDLANSAKLQFRLPQVGEHSSRGEDDCPSALHGLSPEEREKITDGFMTKARQLATHYGLSRFNVNFLDKALEMLYDSGFQPSQALSQLESLDLRKDLKEPVLTKEEMKRFEEGVSKFGSNLHDVARHVGKGQKHGEIVRFYYQWKKSPRGREVWGSFEGRKGKKEAKNYDSVLVDDIADDQDDSAFDLGKASYRRKGFQCKFCSERKSPQWRRAPGTAPGTTVSADGNAKSKDKSTRLTLALCQRCAGLWRKYAIQFEDLQEMVKKVAQTGIRGSKRKYDDALISAVMNANSANSMDMSYTVVPDPTSAGVEVPPPMLHDHEGARKKQKVAEFAVQPQPPPPAELPKKKVVEKPPEPPLIPEQPKLKTFPCAVCGEMEPVGEEHFCCRHCKLTVHRNCYGIAEGRSASKWICDMCSNDATGQLSTSYECALCPSSVHGEFELMEPPKSSHKKKSDREREKERLEKELVIEATDQYHRKQIELGRPTEPREPLKRTSGNNWVHVVCAVFNPIIKFGNAKALEPSEGLGSTIAKPEQECKFCHLDSGACVACRMCKVTFHVSCAQNFGYTMTFDVTPVKGSRRDTINTVSFGDEQGTAEALIFCQEHSISAILHPLNEAIPDTNLNALQHYVRHFKQADLSLTGTSRKAAIINTSTKLLPPVNNSKDRRASLSNAPPSGANNMMAGPLTRGAGLSPIRVLVESEEVDGEGDRIVHLSDYFETEPEAKKCSSCAVEASPKWHKSDVSPLAPKPERAPSGTRRSSNDSQHISDSSRLNTADENDLANGMEKYLKSGMFGPGTTGINAALFNGMTHLRQSVASRQTATSDALNGLDTSTFVTENTFDDVVVQGPENLPTYRCHNCYLKSLREPSVVVSTPSMTPSSNSPSTRGMMYASEDEIMMEEMGDIDDDLGEYPENFNEDSMPITSPPQMRWPPRPVPGQPLSPRAFSTPQGHQPPPPGPPPLVNGIMPVGDRGPVSAVPMMERGPNSGNHLTERLLNGPLRSPDRGSSNPSLHVERNFLQGPEREFNGSMQAPERRPSSQPQGPERGSNGQMQAPHRGSINGPLMVDRGPPGPPQLADMTPPFWPGNGPSNAVVRRGPDSPNLPYLNGDHQPRSRPPPPPPAPPLPASVPQYRQMNGGLPPYESVRHPPRQPMFGPPPRPSSPDEPPPARAITNGHTRAPLSSPPHPMYRSRPNRAQAPFGPPRADSNPFAMPGGSPPRAYHRRSPPRRVMREERERPVTPVVSGRNADGRNVDARNGTWGRPEEQVPNEASASPNLRNLIH